MLKTWLYTKNFTGRFNLFRASQKKKKMRKKKKLSKRSQRKKRDLKRIKTRRSHLLVLTVMFE